VGTASTKKVTAMTGTQRNEGQQTPESDGITRAADCGVAPPPLPNITLKDDAKYGSQASAPDEANELAPGPFLWTVRGLADGVVLAPVVFPTTLLVFAAIGLSPLLFVLGIFVIGPTALCFGFAVLLALAEGQHVSVSSHVCHVLSTAVAAIIMGLKIFIGLLIAGTVCIGVWALTLIFAPALESIALFVMNLVVFFFGFRHFFSYMYLVRTHETDPPPLSVGLRLAEEPEFIQFYILALLALGLQIVAGGGVIAILIGIPATMFGVEPEIGSKGNLLGNLGAIATGLWICFCVGCSGMSLAHAYLDLEAKVTGGGTAVHRRSDIELGRILFYGVMVVGAIMLAIIMLRG
jgi:hypothetical protein